MALVLDKQYLNHYDISVKRTERNRNVPYLTRYVGTAVRFKEEGPTPTFLLKVNGRIVEEFFGTLVELRTWLATVSWDGKAFIADKVGV